MQRFALWAAIAASAGFCVAAVFLAVAGVQYRLAEDRGVEAATTPSWIVLGSGVGFSVFALGLLATIVACAILLIERWRSGRRTI